jgi:hypothetical protein
VGIVFLIMGISIGLLLPKGSPRAEGLMRVEILEQCVNYEDKTWYLIEAGDGQRGYIHCYRGEVGDVFWMWPSDIKGYKASDTPGEKDLIDKPQIDLGITDAEAGKGSEKKG